MAEKDKNEKTKIRLRKQRQTLRFHHDVRKPRFVDVFCLPAPVDVPTLCFGGLGCLMGCACGPDLRHQIPPAAPRVIQEPSSQRSKLHPCVSPRGSSLSLVISDMELLSQEQLESRTCPRGCCFSAPAGSDPAEHERGTAAPATYQSREHHSQIAAKGT